ncbi:hypothetical protein [Streptomyces chryseus]
MVDHGQAVAEFFCFIHVVRGQQNGLAGFSQLENRCPDVPGGDRVEPIRGLVEEDDTGVVQEAAGDVESLLHAA